MSTPQFEREVREFRAKYAQEPRFHTLVDWMVTAIRSGSFTSKELRWASLLATDKTALDREGPWRPVNFSEQFIHDVTADVGGVETGTEGERRASGRE